MRDGEEPTKDRLVLETERLLLRRPNTRDIDSIISIAGDWEVARRLARIPHPYGKEDAASFIDMIVPNEWVWAITWRTSGVLVGMVRLSPSAERDAAELGYYIDRMYWGQGIATEAARSVVHYGTHALGLQPITSGYPSSGRVLRKLGFVEIGRSVRPCLAADSTLPSIETRLGTGRKP